MDADASGQPRVDGGGLTIPDAQGVRVDAQPGTSPDAMVQVTCDGEDTEPNNVQGDAQGLPTSDDCDYDPKDPVPGEGGSIAGSVISGNEDWFTYAATDFAFCQVDPSVEVIGNVRVCMILACNSGGTQLTCPSGTTEVGGEQLGCCGDAAFAIEGYDCDTNDEASKVDIQVTALSPNTCENYTINYSF
tara:strand:+ start:33816 stop:34382 length:567 start_codon:yes stop_codon:yes gene_type:complete